MAENNRAKSSKRGSSSQKYGYIGPSSGKTLREHSVEHSATPHKSQSKSDKAIPETPSGTRTDYVGE